MISSIKLFAFSLLIKIVFLWSKNELGAGFTSNSVSNPSLCRKFSALKDAKKDINQYEELQMKLQKYDPELNPEYTNWVETIKSATLENRTGKDFLDNNNSIQFKRLARNDLKTDIEIPPSENEEFEETLDVIKLPCFIPGEEKFAEYLFVRPDEYEIYIKFNEKNGDKRFILLGNPGISKSWFQYKFILFWLRPDVFEALSGEPTKELFHPKRVMRTLHGRKTNIFLDDSEKVTYLEHEPYQLDRITVKDCTILWEPDEYKTPVTYRGIFARIIATVSPDLERYKEFKKNGAQRYFMPCPSNLQLRLMGQSLREVDSSFTLLDNEINQRIINYGPFFRSALIFNEGDLLDFSDIRDEEVHKSLSSSATLESIFSSRRHIEESKYLRGFSHRVAIYHLGRHPEYKYTELDLSYRFACDSLTGLFEKELATLQLETLLRLYFLRKENYIYKDLLPFIMENTFCKCMESDQSSYLKYRPLINEAVTNWRYVELQFSNVRREAPNFNKMAPGVLYFPQTPNFPLVDMYCISDDKSTIISFQVTTADSHPKALSTYESFLKEIDAKITETKLQLVYCILPEKVKSYNKSKYNPPFFWENYKNDQKLINSSWKDKVCFYAMIFPDSKEEIFRRVKPKNTTSNFEWYNN